MVKINLRYKKSDFVVKWPGAVSRMKAGHSLASRRPLVKSQNIH